MRERMNECEFALRRTMVFDVFGSAVFFLQENGVCLLTTSDFAVFFIFDFDGTN